MGRSSDQNWKSGVIPEQTISQVFIYKIINIANIGNDNPIFIMIMDLKMLRKLLYSSQCNLCLFVYISPPTTLRKMRFNVMKTMRKSKKVMMISTKCPHCHQKGTIHLNFPF